MTQIGTPRTNSAKKVLLLGSGELGKELVIELKRLGAEVIAVDKYENAPAMQVADRFYVIDMLDSQKLEEIILNEKPSLIVPEVEAIATSKLVELEEKGFKVIPTARAVNLTMNREGIRRLANQELGLTTSKYVFAATFEEFEKGVNEIGLPCFVKPIMSSSGHGQSYLKHKEDIKAAWEYAQLGGRAGKGKVIIEEKVDFDYEITLLTVRFNGGTSFCPPIGHIQVNGDYQESWQPQPMSEKALATAKEYAYKVTQALGGYGLFGVELFIKGDEVIFSEVSPRPHDTGMVTLISQNLSEFALHARAILGLPVANINLYAPSASRAICVEGESKNVTFSNLSSVLNDVDTNIRLFGKPEVKGHRRMGVMLASAFSIEEARNKTGKMLKKLKVTL